MAARWRFQIHLSTAIVMMIAAGGMLWINFTGKLVNRGPHGDEIDYGWPLRVHRVTWVDPHERAPLVEWRAKRPVWVYIVVNATVALAVIFVVWFVCEGWIWWRAARKENVIE